MFTGIVQEKGTISSIEKHGQHMRFGVDLGPGFCSGIKTGASVAIDGACLTVVEVQKDKLYFDVIAETLQKTTLGSFTLGSNVNCERSLKMGDEIGGHLLSGHILATVIVDNIEENVWTLRAPKECMRYLFPKGYIALDGVSLTLVAVDLMHSLFTVHLIPETLKRTTLGSKKIKDSLNCEIDSLTLAAVETVARISTMV